MAQSGEAAASATGLIVDTGEEEPIHVVATFSGDSISALDLLHEAELDTVTVDFGGLGQAVCEIADTGCDVSTCRQRLCQTGDPDSPFWQYWEQDETGEWALSPLGASHATLQHGDIAAWVWTGTDPQLGPISWESLAASAGAPEAVVAGDMIGEPAVYRAAVRAEASEDERAAGVLAGAGVVMVVGVVGGWLVLRQRQRITQAS